VARTRNRSRPLLGTRGALTLPLMMLRWPHLPLLDRELRGLANRRSTYVVRSVCALVMLGAALVGFSSFPPGVVGSGLPIFTMVLTVLTVIALAAIPLSSATGIATERDRGTLALVLMTGMEPWRLLAQFWLGQVALGSALLLTAVPILVMAYSWGGVSDLRFATSIAGLVLMVLQLSAIGLTCGCQSRTTMQGAIAAIKWLAVLYLLLPLVLEIFFAVCQLPLGSLSFTPIGLIFHEQSRLDWRLPINLALPLVPALIALRSATTAVATGNAAGLVSTKRYIYDATRPPNLHWASLRFRVPGAKVPVAEPVLWRERHRGAAGTRLDPLKFFAPMLLLGLLVSLSTTASAMFDIQLLLTMVILAIGAAGAIPAERSGQCLEVLLTTPLSGLGIVQQKVRARLRLQRWLSGGLLLLAVASWLAAGLRDFGNFPNQQAVVEIAAAAVAPTFSLWLGMAAGLVSPSLPRTLALLVAVAVAGLVILPLAVDLAAGQQPGHVPMLLLLSPLSLVLAVQYPSSSAAAASGPGWWLILLSVLLWFLGAWALRRGCLACATRLLASEVARKG
jgi:hypothetical protein